MAFIPTDEQKKVLAHDQGRHGRILAGPGTGKSSTVVAYMESLLQLDEPPRLRLLTFTRCATSELAAKIADVTGGEKIRPSTIHSFSISILLANGGLAIFPEPLRIADDWENVTIVIPMLMRQMECGKKDIEAHLKEMAAAWESLDDEPDSQFSESERARFLGVWKEHRTILGYTLLQELPFRLREALVGNPDLDGCKFDLLIVDEYQDMNACDLHVIKLLADEHDCFVLGIGDDDQSIYSFRSAAPEGIRRFPEDYAGSADYPLTESLRCGRQIIKWANHVIRQNTDRPATRADLKPGPMNPEGEVALLSFKDNLQEAKGIAKLISMLMARKQSRFSPSDILVLLRGDYNQQFSKPIKDELDKLNIPYADSNWVSALLAEEPNRRFLALVRLAVYSDDSLAWLTIVTMIDGVGDKFVDGVYEYARSQSITFAQALLTLAEAGFPDISVASARKAKPVIDEVLSWLSQNAIPEEMPDEGWAEWLKNLSPIWTPTNALFDLMQEVETLIDGEIELGRFLGQLTPLGKDIANARADGVRIMSLASSKGLTVRGTIIAGCEEGIIPRPDQKPSEEARLLYVGMTRSREVLYCTWARKRTGPTARAGYANAGRPRTFATFFTGGPVQSQSGADLVK